jgi:cytochrome c553
MKHIATLISVLALGACANCAPAGPTVQATRGLTGDVLLGKQVATRSCGGCHAVAGGASPLADAPAFADLHQRYPPGGLTAVLSEGMLAPSDGGGEEGSRYAHPRMPAVRLPAQP